MKARRVELLVFLFALGVRLVYLRQAAGVPFSSTPITDGAQYWSWAERIAAGDWRGEGVFYQAPLYPYMLAVVRAILGPNLTAVYVLQATLSALGCAFLAAAGRRLFSPVAGIAAGLMVACYAPAILFDGVLQKESLAIFLMSLLCWLLAVSMDAARPGIAAAMGVTIALMALLRQNSLVLAPLLLAWLWGQAGDTSGRARWPLLAWFAAGLSVVLGPVGLRNLAVGGELTLTTSMGANFYIGNSREATGTYIEIVPGRGSPEFEQADAIGLAEKRLGRRLTPREASHYWLTESFKFIRSEPGAWLRLMLRKTLLFWNRYEVADAEDLYFYQRWSWLLRGLGGVWNFGTLFPLAAAGVCLTWPRRRELWLFHALALTTFASVVTFFVFGRYRLPIVPLLILFAAAGTAETAKAVAARRRRSLLVASVAVLSAGLLARLPLFDPQQPLASSFYAWSYVASDAGRVDEAIAAGREAIRLDPAMPEAHHMLCRLLAGKLAFVEALAECRIASGLQPDEPKVWTDLGILLAVTGDRRGAAEALIRSLEQDPGDSTASANLQKLLRVATQANERDVQARIEDFLHRKG